MTPRLSAERILEAAFAVLSEHGLDGLSLRTVADRLGAQAMSLYWYFPNKHQLVRTMAETLYRTAYEATDSTLPWDQWLLAYGWSMQEVLMHHRDSARLCGLAQPAPQSHPNYERLAAPLVRGGLSRQVALSFEAAIMSYVLGWVLWYQNEPARRELDAQFGFSGTFAIGLEALVDGLRRRSPT